MTAGPDVIRNRVPLKPSRSTARDPITGFPDPGPTGSHRHHHPDFALRPRRNLAMQCSRFRPPLGRRRCLSMLASDTARPWPARPRRSAPSCRQRHRNHLGRPPTSSSITEDTLGPRSGGINDDLAATRAVGADTIALLEIEPRRSFPPVVLPRHQSDPAANSRPVLNAFGSVIVATTAVDRITPKPEWIGRCCPR